MRVKNIIAAAVAVPVIFGCAGAFPASAESFIPEVAHTETWMHPYYIDGDTTKPYNYLECCSEVYNDGSVRVYLRNTADWSELAPDDNKEHTVTIKGYSPDLTAFAFGHGFLSDPTNSGLIENELIPITKKMFDEGSAEGWTEDDKNFTLWEKYDPEDLSFCPVNYRMIYKDDLFELKPVASYYYGKVGDISGKEGILYQFEYNGLLSDLPKKSTIVTFRPTAIEKESYTICFLGHDINVMEEMLSDEIFKAPYDTTRKIDELEARCDELEAENETLKALNDADSILRLDANNDGIVDSNDASILLTIYAINSTGGHISKFSELPE